MKRLILIVSLFVVALMLSGCNFIPEDILNEVEDVISEELCVEDPDHVLCDLENILELEDVIIMGLVEEFHAAYMSSDFIEKCELYISPSNPSLLESCRSKEFEILPEGITIFTPETIDNDGENYLVKGRQNLDNQKLIIRLTVVQVDGVFMIDDYSFDYYRVPMEVTLQGRLDLCEMYFKDLTDPSIDDESFYKMYHGKDKQGDPDANRYDFISPEEEIILVEALSVIDSSVHGHVTVLKAHGGDYTLDLTLTLQTDEMGGLYVLDVYETGDIPTEQQFTNLIDSMISAYLNVDVDNETFKQEYGGVIGSRHRLSNREEYIGDRLESISISPMLSMPSYHIVTIILSDEEGIDVLTFFGNFKSYVNDGNKYYRFDGLDNDCDGIDDDCDGLEMCDNVDDDCDSEIGKARTSAIYEFYINEYLDPDSDNDGLLDLIGPQDESFFKIRKEVQDKKTKIVVNDIVGPIEEDMYIVIVDNIYPDGSLSREHKPVRISKEIDKSTPVLMQVLDPDSDNDSLPIEEFYALLEAFKESYNDETMMSEEVCRTYVSLDDRESCFTEREQDIKDGVEIEGIDIVNGNDIVLRKRPGRKNYGNIVLKAGYLASPGGRNVIDFTETSIVDYQSLVENEVEILLMKLNDLTIEVDKVCLSVEKVSMDTCMSLRAYVTPTEMISMNRIEFIDGMLILKLDSVNAEGESIPLVDYEVHIIYEDDMNKLSITPLL